MFNEEAGASLCVRTILLELITYQYDAHIIIVDDASTDKTYEVLNNISRESNLITVIKHAQNLGYGAALKTGAFNAFQAGYKYVLFMDSDLTNDPKYIVEFANKMKAGYDLIKASRYIKGGQVLGVPAWRVIISKWGNIVAGLLFKLKLHDYTNGYRAIKADKFIRMKLKENRFSLIMEEMYWANKLALTVIEIPTTLTNRSREQRRTTFSYTPKTFIQYLKYPLMAFFHL
jgi:dolichol-phosphate mannosyltransferase